MKELSIEEKAKRFDEALGKAKRYYDEYKTRDNILYIEDMEDMFPELKESEDERIRKSISAYFAKFKPNDMWNADFSFGDIVVWLEKQCGKGTNGNERKISIPEPPLTIKHAKEVMGIKQDDAWSEEDEKCIENAIMYCEWARDIAPNLHCYEISEKSINWLKSLKERYTWKPSDEQMETLENVRKILHTNDIYSKANNLMYNFEELIRTLKKLREGQL